MFVLRCAAGHLSLCLLEDPSSAAIPAAIAAAAAAAVAAAAAAGKA